MDPPRPSLALGAVAAQAAALAHTFEYAPTPRAELDRFTPPARAPRGAPRRMPSVATRLPLVVTARPAAPLRPPASPARSPAVEFLNLPHRATHTPRTAASLFSTPAGVMGEQKKLAVAAARPENRAMFLDTAAPLFVSHTPSAQAFKPHDGRYVRVIRTVENVDETGQIHLVERTERWVPESLAKPGIVVPVPGKVLDRKIVYRVGDAKTVTKAFFKGREQLKPLGASS